MGNLCSRVSFKTKTETWSLITGLVHVLLGHVATFLTFADCARLRCCCQEVYLESVREPLWPTCLSLVTLPSRVVTDGFLLRVLQLDQASRWTSLRSLELRSCTSVSAAVGLELLAGFEARRDFDFVWVESCPKRATFDEEVACRETGTAIITFVGESPTTGRLVREAVLVASSFRIRWVVNLNLRAAPNVHSPEFSFAGRRWQVSMFPRGNPRYTTNFVSVYIVDKSLEQAVASGQAIRDFRCFFQIAALNRDDSLTIRKRCINQAFTFGVWMRPGPFDRGFHELLSHERLGPDEGFVVDQALTLEIVLKPACRCT